MTDLIQINESPDLIVTVNSTRRPITFNAAASSNSSNITLGNAGVYQMLCYQSSGSATLSAAVSFQLSGGGTNLAFISAISPNGSFLRTFRTSEDGLVVQISNGLIAGIAGAIQKV